MLQDQFNNEKELFLRVAEGDEIAFAELLKKIIPNLQAIIFKIAKDDDAVREILQEAFIRIWIHREKLPQLENPLAWLKRVALNETFTWLNKNAFRARIFAELHEGLDISIDNPVDNISLHETQKILNRAIDLLPPQRKRIYLLSRKEGMRPGEIARELELSDGYVKNALSLALGSLREKLKKAGKILSHIL